ncbi:hypothetical protein AOL_s00169g180 [Orbilia oligospora ATCC 24927]|uniref:C2H2-type domain-containing protein n=1 Tax=Arthrobotrys oligospora (strain ATCC 24927 / CBS 115.81 / DSM 1491) TaxID=756982 RepID=G1XMX7_ARTOA|nr:hypothetical protein AOL_s00169g180 [Orbilia oligospora ATCC 24927]EGX45574.1 hypothetical protein AOL_s00169g180 [Orbilia oligospora ATCC 24927]
MADGWAENRLVDFDLWSAGAGVSAHGKLSLDERLASKPNIRDGIVRLINLLKVFIDECQGKENDENAEILHEKNSIDKIGLDIDEVESGSDDMDRDEDPLESQSRREQEAKSNVELMLGQIIGVTVAIRKAGSSSRLLRADKTFNPQVPVLQELKAFLELVIYPTGLKTSDNPLSEVQKRLIDVNLRWRNRYLYAKEHSKRLASSRGAIDDWHGEKELSFEQPTTDPTTSSHGTKGPQLPTITSLKAGLVRGDPCKDPKMAIPASTTASAIEGTVVVSMAMASVTRGPGPATEISRITSKIVYPNPPPVQRDKQAFTCPCCCKSLPVSLTERSQWKKHIAGDVCPYTCPFLECSQPFQTYVSRAEWERHIKSEHSKVWKCFICHEVNKYVELSTQNEMESHLRAIHGDAVEESEISLFADASSYSKTPELQCPVCPGVHDETDNLEHIARCIHDFSLRSLPFSSDSNPAEEEYFAETSSHNYGDYSDSSSVFNQSDSEELLDLSFESDSKLLDGLGLTELTAEGLESLSQSLGDLGALNASVTYPGTVEQWIPPQDLPHIQIWKPQSLDDHLHSDRQDIMSWLCPIDYQERFRERLPRNFKETGKWLLGGRTFQSWLQGKNTMLFCSGIPGSGKTTISSVVASHIMQLCAEDKFPDDRTGIAVLCCRLEDERKYGLRELLLSIVGQLAMSQPTVPDSIRDLYFRYTSNPDTPLSASEISDEISVAIKELSRVFIIVDGLEQSHELNVFGSFLVIMGNNTANWSPRVRLMMTVPAGLDELGLQFLAIPVKVKPHREDVEIYLNSQTPYLPKPLCHDLKLWEKVKSRILSVTHEKWVAIESHINAATQVKTPEECIRTLAASDISNEEDELNALYDNFIEIINAQEDYVRSLAQSALLWVVSAKRPLSSNELRYILEWKLGSLGSNTHCSVRIKDALAACFNLITVSPDNDTIQLAHHSENDYLLRYFSSQFNDTGDHEIEIARSCLLYSLESKSFNQINQPPAEDIDYVPLRAAYLFGNWPFLNYTTSYWAEHLKSVQEKISDVAIRFLTDPWTVSLAGQAFWGSSNSGYKGVHLAAYCGLEHILALLLGDRAIVFSDDRGWTPLCYAVQGRQPQTVKWLLEFGARAEEREKTRLATRDTIRRATALNIAKEICDEEIISILTLNMEEQANTRIRSDELEFSPRPRFRCRFPGCEFQYITMDSFRKHERNCMYSSGSKIYVASCLYPGCHSARRSPNKITAVNNLMLHQKAACRNRRHDSWLLDADIDTRLKVE